MNKNTPKIGDTVRWNEEVATLRDLRTLEQQHKEWMRDPDVVAGWYESGEDEEPVFETLYEIEDRYGVLHVIIGEKEFGQIQRGFFYCCACIKVRPGPMLAKRRQGECACCSCVELPTTRKAQVAWLDEEQEAGEQK